jgi:hypothetical protein
MLIIFCYQVIKFKQLRLSPTALFLTSTMEKMVFLVSAFACAIYTLSWPSLNRERWGVRLKHLI